MRAAREPFAAVRADATAADTKETRGATAVSIDRSQAARHARSLPRVQFAEDQPPELDGALGSIERVHVAGRGPFREGRGGRPSVLG